MTRAWLGLVAVPVSLALVGCGGDGVTEPVPTRTIALAAMNNSGISGAAVIRDDEGPNSTVTVSLQGLTPGDQYIGHVHNTSCAEEGGIALTLPTITGGSTGTGSATAQVADNLLTAGEYYIQYHLNIPGVPEVACGDIPAAGAADTRSVWLVEVNLSEVTGFAVISDLPGATALVRVDLLKGLEEGIEYIGHIHENNCAVGGDIVFVLPTITGLANATGSSGAVEVQDALLGVGYYFQYHESMAPAPQIACGDIPGTGIAPTRRVELLEENMSGITGEAVISDVAGANSAVRVVLDGTVADTEYPGHVHVGSCEVQGDIVHVLGSVIGGPAGTGTAISTGVPDNLLVGGYYIQYHEGAPEVACGDIAGSASEPESPPPGY